MVSFVLLFRGIAVFPARAERVPAPGTTTLTLGKPGEYAVAYEYRSVLNGESVTAPEEPVGLSFRIATAETDETVALRTPGVTYTYEVGARAGRIVAYVTIDRPGRYVVEAEYRGAGADSAEPGAVLAVGRNTLRHSGIKGLGGGLGVLGGLTALAVTAIRHDTARRRSRRPAW